MLSRRSIYSIYAGVANLNIQHFNALVNVTRHLIGYVKNLRQYIL